MYSIIYVNPIINKPISKQLNVMQRFRKSIFIL